VSRTLPIVGFALVSIVAVLSATGVNAVARRVIRPDGEVAPAPTLSVSEDGGPQRASVRTRSSDDYLDVVMGKNIFDKAAREAWASRKGVGAGASATSEAPTELRVTLLGTVVAEPSAYSSALIAEEGKTTARGYGIGDKILDREVVAIEPKRVTLKRGEELEYLTMGEEERPVAAASEPTEGGEEGVTQVGENKWEVQRSLLDKYIGDLSAASKLVVEASAGSVLLNVLL
jgi:hypothetical protein